MFSSRSFMVSGFTFRSLILILGIHLHFVYDERKCSNFMLLHVTAQHFIFLNLYDFTKLVNQAKIIMLYKLFLLVLMFNNNFSRLILDNNL